MPFDVRVPRRGGHSQRRVRVPIKKDGRWEKEGPGSIAGERPQRGGERGRLAGQGTPSQSWATITVGGGGARVVRCAPPLSSHPVPMRSPKKASRILVQQRVEFDKRIHNDSRKKIEGQWTVPLGLPPWRLSTYEPPCRCQNRADVNGIIACPCCYAIAYACSWHMGERRGAGCARPASQPVSACGIWSNPDIDRSGGRFVRGPAGPEGGDLSFLLPSTLRPGCSTDDMPCMA